MDVGKIMGWAMLPNRVLTGMEPSYDEAFFPLRTWLLVLKTAAA
jgi:hypothetical protein